MDYHARERHEAFIAQHGPPAVKLSGNHYVLADGATFTEVYAGWVHHEPPQHPRDRLGLQLHHARHQLATAERALTDFSPPAPFSGTLVRFGGQPEWPADLGEVPRDEHGHPTVQAALNKLAVLVQTGRETVARLEKELAGPTVVHCAGGVCLVSR
jgi:hypothetical protein